MTSNADKRSQRQSQMVKAAIAILGSRPLTAIRQVLPIRRVAKAARLSSDTGHRVFRTDKSDAGTQLLLATAQALMEPTYYGFRESIDSFARASEGSSPEHDQRTDPIVAGIESMVEAQFTIDGYCERWLLHSACMAASELFESSRINSQADSEVAKKILQLRGDAYTKMDEANAQFVAEAMDMLESRPKPGISPLQIAKLQHALLDGCVLRMAIDPDAFTPRQVAQAIVDLGVALCEPGSLNDPRRPDGAERSRVFDLVLESAIESWKSGNEVTIESALELASTEEPTADRAEWQFDSLADLADSAIRLKIDAAGDLATEEVRDAGRSLIAGATNVSRSVAAAWMLGILRRLHDAQAAIPQAFEIVDAQPPSDRSILQDLHAAICSYCLISDESGALADKPHQLRARASSLIAAARANTWDEVLVLLESYGLRTVDGDEALEPGDE